MGTPNRRGDNPPSVRTVGYEAGCEAGFETGSWADSGTGLVGLVLGCWSLVSNIANKPAFAPPLSWLGLSKPGLEID